MKKLISVLLIAALCFSLSVSAIAASPVEVLHYVPEHISQFISNRNSEASISNVVPMYNPEDAIIAWLYIIDPIGYVVEDAEHEIIVEFSFSNSVDFSANSKLYYGGPTVFYQNVSDKFYNLKSGAILSDDEANSISATFVETTNLLSNTANLNSTARANKPPYSIDEDEFQLYDYNPDGRCGSVAAAILLAYYNDNGYTDLVADSHYENDVAFTNYLYSHIEGLDNISGSYPADVASGLNWYLEKKDFDSDLAAYYMSEDFPTYISKIDSGDPVCLLMNDEPNYNNHWVVGYGYDYDQIIIRYNRFAIVNDGWGDVDININWDYIVSLVYLKEM